MPAEWAPHAGCWMAWPCRAANWDDIGAARAAYADVARTVARFEPVTMTVNESDAAAARVALAGTDAEVVVVPSDDSWARDTAPTFLVDGRGGLAGVDWRFNAYGGLYAEYGRTGNMARRILDLLGARRFAAPIVLGQAQVGEVVVQAIPGFITGLAGVLVAWLAWWGAVEPIPAQVVAQAAAAKAAPAQVIPCAVCGMPVAADVLMMCPHGCGKAFHQGCHRARMAVFRGDPRVCAICNQQVRA